MFRLKTLCNRIFFYLFIIFKIFFHRLVTTYSYQLISVLPLREKWYIILSIFNNANFLIINGAVLLPYYNSPKDELAKDALQQVFPDREIIGINCLPLIKQHGSLHCVTMQYPEGVI